MKRIFIISMIVIVSCTQKRNKECEEDKAFKENFDNCILIAKYRATFDSAGEKLNSSDVYKAFACLETLTSKKSKALDIYSDLKGYENNQDFESDRISWLKWYDDNKCDFTMDKAERIFSGKRRPMPNYNDPKVLHEIEELYPISYKDSVRSVDSIRQLRSRLDWPAKFE